MPSLFFHHEARGPVPSRVSCVHRVTCLLLKSDFHGHLKRTFDTSLMVTLSMTTVVKSAGSRVEFPDTHVECTPSLASSITRVSLSKNLTVTSLCCECFCQVVPCNGQRLKALEHFLAAMRSEISLLQVRSDNCEAWKHVLKDACEQVHLEYSNTRLETLASNGRGEQ